MKLNLGCGAQVVPGWLNVDYALGARLVKLPLFRAVNRRLRLFNMDWNSEIFLHDLSRPFPWPDASAGVVYSSHTLEHFSKDAGLAFLAECRRVLRPGGVLRVLVPDLCHLVERYKAGTLPADDFVDELGVSATPPSSVLKRLLAPLVQYPHRCMYDAPALLARISGLGFDAAERGPFDSAIADIRAIELPARTEHAVIVEGVKR